MNFQLANYVKSLRTYAVVLAAMLVLIAGQAILVHGEDLSAQNKYDQTLQPISAKELKQALQNYSDDAVMTYQLVLRAGKQDKADVAYETLKELRDKQPKNAVALAGYCLAFDVYEGKYSGPNGTVHNFSGAEQEDYAQTLARAQQLDPRLWMIYAVAGHNVGFGPAADIRSLKLYQKAEKLAPNISFTHVLLGRAYGIYYTPYNSFAKAATEYSKALSLQPASAEAAWGLFDIYDIRTPNAAKAKQAKLTLKKLLPPSFPIGKETSARFARY